MPSRAWSVKAVVFALVDARVACLRLWNSAEASAVAANLQNPRRCEPSMNLDYVSIGRNPPEEVNAIIEVPIGGEPIKYEMDKKAGTLVVDRFLYTPMRYPGNYGFIPHTLSADGDPCDVLVANTRPIVPGAIVAVRPIGVLKMMDEAGGDEKIIAVPIPKLTQLCARAQLHRSSGNCLAPNRAFLCALQGPRRGKVGDFRRLGRRRRGQALYHRGDRASQRPTCDARLTTFSKRAR